MIPKRTLTATLEISTGSLILTSRPPAFQGEVHALALSISLLDGGAAYTPTGNVVAQMYLYWPGTVEMTETVPLTISGSTLTGTLPETLTAVPGCPLLVIQITDADIGDLIVAAASPIQITNVLGGTVISTRPPTPSEIIYVGRSPYIDGVTGNWVQWDTDAGEYVDTGVHAKGDKGDQGIPGPVATVNGVQPDAQGNVQLSGANIPSSAITGAANVDAGLSALSGQIANLTNAGYYYALREDINGNGTGTITLTNLNEDKVYPVFIADNTKFFVGILHSNVGWKLYGAKTFSDSEVSCTHIDNYSCTITVPRFTRYLIMAH